MVEQQPYRTQQLWLVPLDGSAPQPVNHGGSVYRIRLVARWHVYRLHCARKVLALSGSYIEKMEFVVMRREALAEREKPRRTARHRQRQPA